MEGPWAIIAAMLLLSLAGVGVLIAFISRGAVGSFARTAILTAALVDITMLTILVGSYTSIFYVKPIGLLAATVLLLAGAVVLFVMVGRSVGWKASRVAAMIGLVFVTQILFAAIAIAATGSGWTPPLPYETRAQQIAEANGFEVLLPAGEKMNTESLPIDRLGEPESGLYVEYEGFQLQERKDGTGSARDTFWERVSSGLPEGATRSDAATVTVNGVPGLVVDFKIIHGDGQPLEGSKTEEGRVLVFLRDGVDIRIVSHAGVRESGGDWVYLPAHSAKDLVAIAETLEPPE